MQTIGSGGESECVSELSRSAACEPSSEISAHPPYAAARRLHERRLDAMRTIDESSLSRFRFRVYMVAFAGFMTDAYDIFAINLAMLVIEGINCKYVMELIMITITIFFMWFTEPVLGAFMSLGVLAIWKFIASGLARTGSLDRVIPAVFTPEGWGKLADSLAALVWGARRGAGSFGNGRQRRAERRRKERASRRPGGSK